MTTAFVFKVPLLSAVFFVSYSGPNNFKLALNSLCLLLTHQETLFLSSFVKTVSNYRHQIESEFVTVVLDPLLDLSSCQLEPVLVRARSKVDGSFLETIEFVKLSVKWDVRDEVKSVFSFSLWIALFFYDKRVIPSEGVMCDSYLLATSNSMSSVFEREELSKLL